MRPPTRAPRLRICVRKPALSHRLPGLGPCHDAALPRDVDKKAMLRIPLNRWSAFALLTGAALIVALGAQRGAVGSLLPHGYCFTWNPALLWTHVVSDSLIGAAYVSIPITLLQLVRKRTDLPFNWSVVLIALFILSCGATHWIEVWTVWNPDYWLSGNVKALTALVSVLTAIALVRLLPRILAIPTVDELTAARDALQLEVGHRRLAEEALLHERAALEQRVIERTQALSTATAAAAAAHAQAEEANQLKDRFLAKVSHELRTPLQSTMTWAQLLQRSPDDTRRAAQASDRIMHNVRTQARLIDDLLDISRILSGKLGLQVRPIDAVQVIRKAVDVVRSACVERQISIELRMRTPETVPLRSDGVRLEQVVWNLVNNAVQASAQGGRVQVDCSVDAGRALQIEVRDEGRGIRATDLPHIFEPFRQDAAGSNAHRGLGLGLAITRSIVDLFGGDLRATSEGEGRGAVFFLRLPLSTDDATTEEPSALDLDADERQRMLGLRVLYVEDEPDIAEGGRQMLAALGAQVSLCLDFETAALRIAQGGFEVVLSDLNLGGGKSALDLIRLLRATPFGQGVPAIVLSAYGRAEDRETSLNAGFSLHLVKPTDAAEVARALLAVTSRVVHA